MAFFTGSHEITVASELYWVFPLVGVASCDGFEDVLLALLDSYFTPFASTEET